MKRDCLCGHPWAIHANWTQCALCTCPMYTKKPRRRWWRLHTRPAAEEKGSSPEPRGASAPHWAPPLLPGPAPVPAVMPPTSLRAPATTNATVTGIVLHWSCTCETYLDPDGRYTGDDLCPIHADLRAWDSELRQP